MKGKGHQLVLLTDNKLLRQRAKAEKKLQTIYFASVAHDLRTPLNSLLASNNSLRHILRNNPDLVL